MVVVATTHKQGDGCAHLSEKLQPSKEVVVLVRPMHDQCVYAQGIVQVDGKTHQRLTGQARQINLVGRGG